ncbi:hypothetical protein RR46_00932 [Papilio xuthus]|uniref:Uncharacterized protein n=1 Tax=Papilio xuthus TaxID=66420 RepID=A0A0N1PKH8_PAPXU|nr:hypothetical protein RR46_00932 [Papilio xuthus]
MKPDSGVTHERLREDREENCKDWEDTMEKRIRPEVRSLETYRRVRELCNDDAEVDLFYYRLAIDAFVMFEHSEGQESTRDVTTPRPDNKLSD